MPSHWRVLSFCIAILAAPFLWLVGERIGGSLGGWLLAGAVIGATALYAEIGQRKPPSGAKSA